MTGNGGGDNTGRQKWTKHRTEELKHRRQDYKKNGYPGGDVRNPFSLGNPYLTGDDAALRRRDAIKRQHEIDTIELLMLKKERGELSPAGQKKLNQLIRHVQNQ